MRGDGHIEFTLGAELGEIVRRQEAERRAADLAQLRHDMAVHVEGYHWCEDCYLTPDHVSNGDPYDAFTVPDEMPDYLADLHACQRAEQHLVESGHGAAYVAALRMQVGPDDLALVMASAEERCRAMVAACRPKSVRKSRKHAEMMADEYVRGKR